MKDDSTEHSVGEATKAQAGSTNAGTGLEALRASGGMRSMEERGVRVTMIPCGDIEVPQFSPRLDSDISMACGQSETLSFSIVSDGKPWAVLGPDGTLREFDLAECTRLAALFNGGDKQQLYGWAALAAAIRKAALEEAARVCDAEEDNIGPPATYCGRLIRALSDQAPS